MPDAGALAELEARLSAGDLTGLAERFSGGRISARDLRSRSVRPFPWAEAMQFGFGVLRLSSRSFWALTPRELARAFEAVAGRRATAPGRENLNDLMAAFPDQETQHA